MKQEAMKSLTKALTILKLFSSGRNEMSLGEIAKLSGLSISTASRIASVLVKHDYLKQREKRGKYSLGTIYLYYGSVIKSKLQIRETAIPYLMSLSQQLKETVIIGFENGINPIYTEMFQDTSLGTNLLTVVQGQGLILPLHATSVGKMILAFLTEDQLRIFFESKNLERYTPATITDINNLKRQLDTVKRKGFAFDNEEYSLGVRSVGAGIRDNEGRILGSIAAIAPSIRLTSTKIRELAPIVKNCAMEISREFGFNKQP